MASRELEADALAGDKTGFTDYDKIGVPKNLQSFIQLFRSGAHARLLRRWMRRLRRRKQLVPACAQ